MVLMEKLALCFDSSYPPSEQLSSESDSALPLISSLIFSKTSVKMLVFARPFEISLRRLALIYEILL